MGFIGRLFGIDPEKPELMNHEQAFRFADALERQIKPQLSYLGFGLYDVPAEVPYTTNMALGALVGTAMAVAQFEGISPHSPDAKEAVVSMFGMVFGSQAGEPIGRKSLDAMKTGNPEMSHYSRLAFEDVASAYNDPSNHLAMAFISGVKGLL